MDRIAALRNVEDALAAFEQGEIDLATAERRVRTVLRTYATEFDEGQKAVYRVEVSDRGDALILVADSPGAARERAKSLTENPIETVARLDEAETDNRG